MTIQKIARSISLFALFLIPLFALIVANPFFFPFITGKAFFFRILVEIAFAGWLILACIEPKYRPKLTPLTIVISLFAIVTLAADLLGVHPLRSIWSNFERMEGWMTIIHLWGLFIVMTTIFGKGEEGRRMWYRWFNVELIAASIVGLYGVSQLLGWADIHQGSTRIDASLGNAAYMAVYLLWNAGIALYMSTVARAKQIANAQFLSWLYPVLSVFFAFLLIQTSTRGTILGLVGGLLVGLTVYAIFGKNQSTKSRYISGGAVVLIVLLGITFWSLRSQPFIQKNAVLSRMANISLSNSETSSRLYIWGMAVTGWKERPILGWGQENFNYIFNANYNPKLYAQEQWFDRAHSVYLDWLVASGALGFLVYLSLYVFFVVGVSKSRLSFSAKSIFIGILTGYAIHNVFVFDNLASYLLFFVALAFVSSLNDENSKALFGAKALGRDSVEYIAAPVVILALLGTLYFFNVRQIQANIGLITALEMCNKNPDAALFQKVLDTGAFVAFQETREQLLSCAGTVIRNQNAPVTMKQSFFQAAGTAIGDQIASTKLKDARAYVLAGSFLDSIGQFNSAASYFETAHQLSPAKQSISLQLGLGYINNGDVEKAVPLLKGAYEAAPENIQAAITYAVSLIVSGKESEARKTFGTDPKIFETVQLAQAYAFTKQYEKAVKIYALMHEKNPDDMNLTVQYAQAQFAAGQKIAAAATLRSILKNHPEYKDQIEAAIKQAE